MSDEDGVQVDPLDQVILRRRWKARMHAGIRLRQHKGCAAQRNRRGGMGD